VIPKSHYEDSFTGQEFLAYFVVELSRESIVADTVELNRQARFDTIKIEDVLVDWMLAPEFSVSKIPVSQMPPQSSFVARTVPTQVPGLGHARSY
jgi:hypothetical protein